MAVVLPVPRTATGRSLDGAADYLHVPVAAVTSFPVTFCAFIRFPAAPSGDETILCFGDSSDWIPLCRLYVNSSRNVVVQVRTGGLSNVIASHSIGVNMLTHVAGTFDADGHVTAFKDGVPGSTASANTVALGAVDLTAIGAHVRDSVGEYFEGEVFNAAIFDAELSQPEISAIALGVDPHEIRPSNLKGFWLHGDQRSDPELDLSGNGNHMSLVGNPGIVDSPIKLPPRRLILPGEAAAASSAPVFLYHQRHHNRAA